MSVLQEKQWARRVAPEGKISQHRMNSTQREVSTTNVYETTLAKGVCRGCLDPNMHDGGRLEATAMSATDKWIVAEKLAKLGTVNSAERRKPK